MKSKNRFKETEIGMIPEDWEVKKLDGIKSSAPKAIAMGPFGSNIRKENYKETGIPVIRGFNLKVERFLDDNFVFLSEEKAGELAGSSAFPEDIIFVAQGGVGQVGIIPRDAKYERYILSQNLMKISCDKEKTDPFFVFYFFRSKRGQDEILSYINPTGVPCISQPLSSLKLFRLPSPNLGEQKIIGGVLSSLDEKIELNQKMSLTMEKIGQALFKHWFVDFEFRDDNGKPYKSSGGEMVDSELGEIPKGWKVRKLGDFVDVIKGVSYTSNELKDSDTALVTLKSIDRGGGLNRNGFKEYVGEYKKEQEIIDGDIVVAHTDLTQKAEVLGKPAIVRTITNYKSLVASLDLSIVRPKDNRTNKPYLFYLLMSEHFQNHAFSYSNGTTVLHLSNKAVPNFEFILPENKIVLKFGEITEILLEKKNNNEREIDRLSEIRDSLLPKLMSGKIRVGSAA